MANVWQLEPRIVLSQLPMQIFHAEAKRSDKARNFSRVQESCQTLLSPT